MSGARFITIARESWGADLPDWVELLANECDQRSQATAAEAMRCSPTLVNRVLRRLYDSDYSGPESRVRGAFQAAKVICPLLGEMPQQTCLEHQRAPYAGTNNFRVRLFKACRSGCPHSRIPTRSPAAKE